MSVIVGKLKESKMNEELNVCDSERDNFYCATCVCQREKSGEVAMGCEGSGDEGGSELEQGGCLVLCDEVQEKVAADDEGVSGSGVERLWYLRSWVGLLVAMLAYFMMQSHIYRFGEIWGDMKGETFCVIGGLMLMSVVCGVSGIRKGGIGNKLIALMGLVIAAFYGWGMVIFSLS